MPKIGEVCTQQQKRIYKDTHAEWKIAEFLSVAEHSMYEYYDSPTFSVAGVPFFFQLYPKNKRHPEYASLYLRSNMNRQFALEYTFGFKLLDGSVKQLYNGIMREKHLCSEQGARVVTSQVLRQNSELVSSDVLTITCTLKPKTVHSIETSQSHKAKALKLIRLDKLSENFKSIFEDKDTCDTTLKVQDKEYKAHRLVLMARSNVFAATFKHDTLEKQKGTITIPDCDPDSFQLFLDFLYSGQLEELSFYTALNLYYTSDKYDVQDLKEFCIENIMHCLTVENVCEAIVFADRYSEMQLFIVIQDFFNQKYCEILSTFEWNDLLKRDKRLATRLLKKLSIVKR